MGKEKDGDLSGSFQMDFLKNGAKNPESVPRIHSKHFTN